MTLRQKFEAKPKYLHAHLAAALILAIYEKESIGGANLTNQEFQKRVNTLAGMSDTQFEKEHYRIMFELSH